MITARVLSREIVKIIARHEINSPTKMPEGYFRGISETPIPIACMYLYRRSLKPQMPQPLKFDKQDFFSHSLHIKVNIYKALLYFVCFYLSVFLLLVIF